MESQKRKIVLKPMETCQRILTRVSVYSTEEKKKRVDKIVSQNVDNNFIDCDGVNREHCLFSAIHLN